MKIPRAIYDGIVEHAVVSAPRECCGILGIHAEQVFWRYEAANIHEEPESSFRVCPEDQQFIFDDMRRRALPDFALYHSHPNGPAWPSSTDVRLAFYPDALHVIVGMMDGTPDVRAFWIRDGRPVDAPLTVVESIEIKEAV